MLRGETWRVLSGVPDWWVVVLIEEPRSEPVIAYGIAEFGHHFPPSRVVGVDGFLMGSRPRGRFLQREAKDQ